VEVTFLVDTMLGKLAKWLRVMGYDTLYQSSYGQDTSDRPNKKKERLFLSRNEQRVRQYPHSLLIRSDRVNAQLQEIKNADHLTQDRSAWFSRCLICNLPLDAIAIEDAGENVPEYVLYQGDVIIRFCPSCKRYFWKGTHRDRMIKQLEEWGY
jgi:uncharacterized protein with PIN domain